MKPSEDFNKLSNVLEAAESAFWKIVASYYPEAVSGDLSPDASINFAAASEDAIVEWVRTNADPAVPDWRTTEILLHRIEYRYEKEMLLTDGDEEHIAYSITQGISEGELCTLIPDPKSKAKDIEVRGYWRINNV